MPKQCARKSCDRCSTAVPSLSIPKELREAKVAVCSECIKFPPIIGWKAWHESSKISSDAEGKKACLVFARNSTAFKKWQRQNPDRNAIHVRDVESLKSASPIQWTVVFLPDWECQDADTARSVINILTTQGFETKTEVN